MWLRCKFLILRGRLKMLDHKNLINKDGLTEEEFLRQYSPGNYERPSVTVDMLLFTVVDKVVEDIRKLNEKELTSLVLLLQGYSYHDISKILHKSYNQVYYQISLIKKKIMQEIKKNSTKSLAFSKWLCYIINEHESVFLNGGLFMAKKEETKKDLVKNNKEKIK